MRRILCGFLTLILLILGVKIVVTTYKEIQDKNLTLESKISTASRGQEQYKTQTTKLSNAKSSLDVERAKYDEWMSVATDEQTDLANQLKKYELEFLYTTIGDYATSEGVDLKMQITVNNAQGNTYDIHFTAIGTYIGVTDFLYNIDGDPDLLFKIDKFKMTPEYEEKKPGSKEEKLVPTGNVIAEFVCANVGINIDNSKIVVPEENTDTEETNTNNNTTNNNTTNTVNDNTTNSNTTNTTNDNTTNAANDNTTNTANDNTTNTSNNNTSNNNTTNSTTENDNTSTKDNTANTADNKTTE